MLTPIPLEDSDPELIPELIHFITDAERQAAAWIGKVERYERSDSLAVWSALCEIRDREWAPGPRFCEWGSGLGIAATLSSWAGFTAYGVEQNRGLVRASRQLAHQAGMQVYIMEGDYADAPPADLVFAYPWPDEEEALRNLFEEKEAAGSLLLLYRGLEDMVLLRK